MGDVTVDGELLKALNEMQAAVAGLSSKFDVLAVKFDGEQKRSEERHAAMKESIDQRFRQVESDIDREARSARTSIETLVADRVRFETNQAAQGQRVQDVEHAVKEMEGHSARIDAVERAASAVTDHPARLRKVEDALTSARAVLYAAVALGGASGGLAAALVKVLG